MNDEQCRANSFVVPLCDWLIDATIYNHKYEEIPKFWLMDRVDAIVLYFSMRNADRFNIMDKFREIHNNTRHINMPIEVLNVPMDDNEMDMRKSFEDQADWYTLMYDDPLINILKYRYGITCVPYLLVMRTDGTIVSSNGILDLDEYGQNALIAWMSSSATSKNPRRLYKDLSVFDLSADRLIVEKSDCKVKFNNLSKNEVLSHVSFKEG